MPHSQNKHQIKENLAKVRKLFWEAWDPIGVQGCGGPEDEYDRYADRAYVMLMQEEASKEVIAAYLYDIASNCIGLGESAEGLKECQRVAEILVSMRPEFESHQEK